MIPDRDVLEKSCLHTCIAPCGHANDWNHHSIVKVFRAPSQYPSPMSGLRNEFIREESFQPLGTHFQNAESIHCYRLSTVFSLELDMRRTD